MFGNNKPVVFDPYGRRRSGWRVPNWLLLLVIGLLAGAAGVIYVQERYLPPRLSPDESAALRQAFDSADTQRQSLQKELADTRKQLDAALADKKSLGSELATSRATTDRQREDLAAVVASLPPDPRGGGVEVRAGRFTASGSKLDYDIVLTRARAGAKPMAGVLQLVVAGESSRGGPNTVSPKPQAVSIGTHEIVRGSVTLPEGFKPQQTTVQVLDREAGKSLGMRVLLVKPPA
ncbi:MAG TPA: hypothetical protein VGQ91_11815 [Ideonella sp.]|jgi:hypothetical protein|nr:hypothetical protein [Ideonella sp.]